MTATFNPVFGRSRWQTIVMFALMFWLSSSLVLDLVVMPGLYTAGMMSQTGFATAGYSIFWVFNRVELVCAALALTGVLALGHIQALNHSVSRSMVALAIALVAIALSYTYALTPTMSALGVQLDLFTPIAVVPQAMTQLHEGYWILEVIKCLAASTLLGFAYQADLR